MTFVFCLLILLCQTPIARADDKALFDRLEAIHTISEKNNDEGIRQLEEFKKSLPSTGSSKIRLRTLALLSDLYWDAGKSKLGTELNEEFKRLAQQENDEDALLSIQIFDSWSIFEKSGEQASFEHLSKLQSVVKKRNDPDLTIRFISVKARLNEVAGHFDVALKLYFEMLALADQLGRGKVQAKMYTWNAITGLYLNMKDPEKALAVSAEALAYASSEDAPKSYMDMVINRGVAFTTLQRHDEALAEYERVLALATKENIPGFAALAKFNMADQYLIRKDYKKAEVYATEAMQLSESIGDTRGVTQARVNVGFAKARQGNVKQGIDLVNQSLEFFRKNKLMGDVEAILGEMVDMYEEAGMYHEALLASREQRSVNTEVFQTKRARDVAILQEQFEAEQRKKQIELLAKDNAIKDVDIKNNRLRQMIALLASVIALLVGGVIYALYRRSIRLNLELKEVNSQLEFHAVRDPLTGLYNRRSFITLMSARGGRVEVDRREGSLGNPDCMILLDIDLFKNINDTYGHAVGDTVLKEVATRLRGAVRDEDMLMRWGGEEFLIFSPKSNPEQLTSLVERVLREVGGTPYVSGDLVFTVTVTAGFISIPFSDVPEEFCDWERALQIADMALYLGKTHGRNRAYGLSRLLVPYEEAIPTLTHDLAMAIRKNMVNVIEVLGPVDQAKQ
ncbi:MAG: GGDEF domain-containing protein [Undibacterium sp.]|nr:GGDEF domain-containing protein [Undibacterium sp.]